MRNVGFALHLPDGDDCDGEGVGRDLEDSQVPSGPLTAFYNFQRNGKPRPPVSVMGPAGQGNTPAPEESLPGEIATGGQHRGGVRLSHVQGAGPSAMEGGWGELGKRIRKLGQGKGSESPAPGRRERGARAG